MKPHNALFNWLSFAGFVLTVNSLFLILIFYIITLTSRESNNYLGVYIYIVLPFFLLLGIALILAGIIVLRRRRNKKGDGNLNWPALDLNIREHRTNIIKVSVISFLFLIISAIGTYNAYEYTNSVGFCGGLCHSVMEPEYTTYLNSPHARVPCVACHIGEGAGWYVKSKLAGIYQAYSVLFHKYPTPITTPVSNLRPERPSCERCHWPRKFYSTKIVNEVCYLSDSANTAWNISLLVKIGPRNSANGLTQGIHWHINPDIKIEYLAGTPDLETIPWIRYTNLKTGVVKIFTDQTNLPSAVDLKKTDLIRTMECIDCHNRASHLYLSPSNFIDLAFNKGILDKELPFIKSAALMATAQSFNKIELVKSGIEEKIKGYYRENHPVIWKSEQLKIEKAVQIIQQEYLKNFFPSMKADAGKYPNHIGHMETRGCFRCHSGKHKTSGGETISRDCNLCHTIVEQGSNREMTDVFVREALEFRHPVDIQSGWKEQFCSDCHRYETR